MDQRILELSLLAIIAGQATTMQQAEAFVELQLAPPAGNPKDVIGRNEMHKPDGSTVVEEIMRDGTRKVVKDAGR